MSRISVLIACLILASTQLPAQTRLDVPLTVQETLYPGAPTRGITRNQGPVTVGVPLADSAGIKNISQLGLKGAAAGQFRILGRWPSGNAQWVLVDTQADVGAGKTYTGISLTGGKGNFGGRDLASDQGATIAVDTGAARFVIRKAKFNLFDEVAVNGKSLVTRGASQGLVVMGPSSGTSCGTCNNPYASSNDPHSTATIEENGPVRAVVKAIGSHVDSAGHAYMHYTVRMSFYRGKTYSKVEVILRNADETNNPAGDFNSAFKGFASYEARVTPALGQSRTFEMGTDSRSVSGRFSGNENAYLYQAYSNNMEIADWNTHNCDNHHPHDNRCVASYIARTQGRGGYVYAQDGYQLVHGNSVLASGDHARYPQGWAELRDESGAGIEIGVYELSAYWPKSLQFVNGGSEVRVGIWPDQALFTKGGGQPYYQAWPAYSIHDLYFEFHAAAPSAPANQFLSFQHYLVARASISQYNSSGVFFYPLLDSAAEDNYYRSIGVACCLADKPPKIFRRYDWPGSGAGNQHELRWSYLRNFLQRGLTGRYLFAAHFYRMIAERSFPRSDGFDWRNHPQSQLDYLGFPENIVSANTGMATRNWMEGQHAHWYGMTDFYFMTGDETIKDQLLDGVKDKFLNPNSPVNNGRLAEARDVGGQLMGIARLYTALIAMNDPDAKGLLVTADKTLDSLVFPELNLSGFGNGKPVPGLPGSHGISRTRGVQYGCCNTDTVPGFSGRVAAPFREAILVEGMWELAQVLGPSWPHYNLLTDLASGVSQWALTEGFGSPPGEKPTAMNSGFIYEIFLDQPNGTSKYYLKPGDSQTTWFHFYVMAAYAGDLSWRHTFEGFMKRSSSVYPPSIWAEYGSHMMQAAVSEILHPPHWVLAPVPITVQNKAGGSYALTWTVPQGATHYRIKYYVGKSIVDWIGFNAGTNTYIGDPNKNWAWFASDDAPGLPAHAAAGTTQTYVFKGEPDKDYHFAMKAYVETGSRK
jgi:hypothetical protein